MDKLLEKGVGLSYYNYTDFQKACGDRQKDVIPINNVLRDSKKDFNLNSKSKLLEFIFNGGLEDLKFINTKEWENNYNKLVTLLVDAYEFRTMHKLGYIAFIYNDVTMKWIIKSFHLSDNRNPAMFLALKEAGLLEENDDEQ
jgi:hypothetical protein